MTLPLRSDGTVDRGAFQARVQSALRRGVSAAVREITAGIPTAEDAWAVLAARGVIPRAWLDRGPPRAAAWEGCARCGASGQSLEHERRIQRRGQCIAVDRLAGGGASDLEAALRLASDPRGAEAVEALAGRFAAALTPWLGRAPGEHRWWAAPPAKYSGVYRYGDVMGDVGEACYFSDPHGFVGTTWVDEPGDVSEANVDVAAFEVWRRASIAGERVVRDWPGWREGPPPAAGVPFADLPNPLEPLLEIWLQGYWVVAVTRREVVLSVTPPKQIVGNAGAGG